jgi:hypothetical protein
MCHFEDEEPKMAKRKLQDQTPGYMTYLWLDGTNAKKHHYVVGSLRGRGKYGAWTVHLLNGLKDRQFQLQLETEPDAWNRAKLVGQKISQLRDSYGKLSAEEKSQLAKESETELRAGLQMLAADKKSVLELVAAAADP